MCQTVGSRIAKVWVMNKFLLKTRENMYWQSYPFCQITKVIFCIFNNTFHLFLIFISQLPIHHYTKSFSQWEISGTNPSYNRCLMEEPRLPMTSQSTNRPFRLPNVPFQQPKLASARFRQVCSCPGSYHFVFNIYFFPYIDTVFLKVGKRRAKTENKYKKKSMSFFFVAVVKLINENVNEVPNQNYLGFKTTRA